jgi:hypothetical protein
MTVDLAGAQGQSAPDIAVCIELSARCGLRKAVIMDKIVWIALAFLAGSPRGRPDSSGLRDVALLSPDKSPDLSGTGGMLEGLHYPTSG